MTTTMSALSSASIRHAEFIRMQVGKPGSVTTYTFCNAAASITVSGITFAGMGSLLGLSEIQQDMKNTSADLSVTLTGIASANIAILLGADIKGSTVEVWRGFLDSNNQIITSPSTQFFKRYSGIINSASISEQWDDGVRQRVATCTVSCCSMRRVLENLVSGMKTNDSSWKFKYPGDSSMSRVAAISNTYFDFGKPPEVGGVAGDPAYDGNTVGVETGLPGQNGGDFPG
jgi:hypothetical protein